MSDPIVEVSRALLIYAHLIICAVALGRVILADIQIARGAINQTEIRETANQVVWLLAGLWLTGLSIIYLDTGFDLAIIATKSKLLLKLLCAAALTLNGMVLHHISFPVLSAKGPLAWHHSTLLAVTGSLSTSHWLLAAFVGVTKPLGLFSIETLLMGYCAAVMATIIVALASAPMMYRLLTDFRLACDLRQIALEHSINKLALGGFSIALSRRGGNERSG